MPLIVSWSDDGRLRLVSLPSGGTVRYAYDPLGRRVAWVGVGGVRRVQTYGLDPNAVAEQSGGGPVTRFTFGLGFDVPLAMSAGSVTSFFAQDALSSVTSLSDAAGAVVGRTSYDTYGQIVGQSGQVSPYTYTGRSAQAGTANCG